MTGQASWCNTAATRALNVEIPIVLGPFGGASSVELTATVSQKGGLGSYGLYGYSPDRILETNREIRRATSKPYALNVWLPLDGCEEVRPSEEQFAAYLQPLLPYFAELGVIPPRRPNSYLPTFASQIDAVFEARPPIISFVYGVPPTNVLDRARTLDITTLGTATTVDEAIALDSAGVNVVIASGAEAAGHRVSFLRPAADSLIGTFALVPQVVDAVSAPVIAAGGIADGRGLIAALTLGAGAAQIGSAFLATHQSGAPPAHKAALFSASATNTILTYAMSGRLARGIANRLATDHNSLETVAPFPIQNWLTGRFRPTANERGLLDYMSLWTGQSSPLIRHNDAATLFDALLAAGNEHFGSLP
jgi:nitronate monooxygenase